MKSDNALQRSHDRRFSNRFVFSWPRCNKSTWWHQIQSNGKLFSGSEFSSSVLLGTLRQTQIHMLGIELHAPLSNCNILLLLTLLLSVL